MPHATTAPCPFALGTADWGATLSGDALDRLYDAFRVAGGRVFDTAHVYACWLPGGDGTSERALADVVRRRGDRARVMIATKGGHPPLKGMYDRPADYLSPRQIAADIADSLQRLGDDAIDLYFLHRDDPRVPVGEIVDTLHEHVAAGRLKSIGVSNWTTTRLAEANEYANAHAKTTFVASQPKFSLGVPKPSKDTTVPAFDDAAQAWHAASGVTVYAYSAAANGYFASRGAKAAGGWGTPASAARLRVAEAVAADTGATPNQIALAWLMLRPFPVVPILGTRDVAHLVDALGAVSVRLTVAQNDALTHAV